MNETQAREALCRVGQSLFARGYVHATAGNISLRLDDGFLITPTDACLGFLDPAQLAFVDAHGQARAGARPSKTLALHRQIYQAAHASDPATRCIIHTHSTHCVALSLNPEAIATALGPELLPALTPYFVMKVGHVPLIPYHRPGSEAAAQAVAQAMARYATQGTPIRAVMLSRLGPNVWHDSPEQAMATLEELEETARLWILNRQQAQPLASPALQELRDTFAARW